MTAQRRNRWNFGGWVESEQESKSHREIRNTVYLPSVDCGRERMRPSSKSARIRHSAIRIPHSAFSTRSVTVPERRVVLRSTIRSSSDLPEPRSCAPFGPARRYWTGHAIGCSSSRATRNAQYGSRRNSRAMITASACFVRMMCSACLRMRSSEFGMRNDCRRDGKVSVFESAA
jgi:hypothetical protein